MSSFRASVWRSSNFLTILALFLGQFAPAQQPQPSRFPFPEVLTYRVEWGLVPAGTVNLEFRHSDTGAWNIKLDLESSGVLNHFHRVQDKYTVSSNENFCPSSALLDAQEGIKHKITRLTFDARQKAVDYFEHDLVKNTDKQQRLAVPACTQEIAGGLAKLGEISLPPGRSVSLPLTDGKKLAYARIDAQAKETVAIDGKKYQTVRYEAFIFDNVLYRRKGRVFLWLTDDGDRVPVQMRIQLGFPVGNISLELEKQQKL